MTNTPDHSNTDARSEDSPKGGHPGPVDEGKNGGMATRELAPDLADADATDGDATEGKSSD